MQGMSRVTIAALVVVFAGALAVPATAGPPPTPVDVGDDFFNPSNATQLAESSTTWFWNDDVEHKHDVLQDDKLFKSGPPTNNPSTVFGVSLPAGTYHYYCTTHGSRNGSGMDGTVKSRLALGGLSAESVPVTWGNNLVDVEPQYDVRFKVGSGKWKNWLKNTQLGSSQFGAGDEPVNLKPGKTYKLQARTENAANDERRSGWSPTASFEGQP